MAEKMEKKMAPGWGEVEVLGATFEPGEPQKGGTEGRWRNKFDSREERLKYLRTAERYWYSKDWFGSEKRKTPA